MDEVLYSTLKKLKLLKYVEINPPDLREMLTMELDYYTQLVAFWAIQWVAFPLFI
jgi:hypothetical protein